MAKFVQFVHQDGARVVQIAHTKYANSRPGHRQPRGHSEARQKNSQEEALVAKFWESCSIRR